MTKAVLLDRDGTINEDTGYTHKIDDLSFVEKAKEGLSKLAKEGFKLIIITSQSGIGRGYYSEEQYHKFMDYMKKELKKYGVRIEADYFCPHLPGEVDGEYGKECDCRKPQPGMYKEAVKEHDIDLEQSYAIGDKARDLIPARKLGIKTVFVQTGSDDLKKFKPDYKAKDLLDAANWIMEQDRKKR